MKYLVKRVLILDLRSPFYKKTVDILVENGCILSIAKSLTPTKSDTIIKGNKLTLATALVDINASSGEPDNLEAETLTSLRQAATRGGFAYVAHMPTETKSIQSKADIFYLKSENKNSLTQILPIGNISQATNNQQLSAMMDMKKAGAVAFSDGNEDMLKLSMLKNALLYTKGFGAKLMLHADKKDLSNNGQVNQGLMSVTMGYKGIPREAEYMATQEIANIIEYTDTTALILNITTPESLEAIQSTNKKQKRITTATSTFHISLDESRLNDYDTNYKLSPPLRSDKDRKKLIKACIDGKIDILYSQHSPKTTEDKVLEFDLASCGAINLQTAFISAIDSLGAENIEKCIEMLSTNPAEYLDIELPVFKEKTTGEFILFDLKDAYEFTGLDNKSKSKNSPFFNHKFSSKIRGLIGHGGQEFFG
jgi:dihydroorotase